MYPSTNRSDQQDVQDSSFGDQSFGQYMAGAQSQAGYLSANQQDLLLAALNSQADGRQNISHSASTTQPAQNSTSQQSAMNGASDNGFYISPHEATLNDFDDYSPDLDYLDGDNFDFDNADLGGEMIGGLPGELNGTELHEKRKNSEDGDEEGDPKRHESQDGERSAKKPGRKPLTSEPTTKRKAQNRAAQRAFRERKEAHLKDLETKVTELTKAQEADKHENGMLKAQVERLQVELREYRKRLSLNGGSGANRSPPLTGNSQGRSNSNSSTYGNNSFQFDFPKFGALPGSQIFGQALNGSNSSSGQRTSATPPTTASPTNGSFSGPSQTMQNSSRQNSLGARSMSPGNITGTSTGSPGQMSNVIPTFATYSTNDNMHGFASTLPQMSSTSTDPFGDLFSPSILKSASMDSTANYFPGINQAEGTPSMNGASDPYGGDSTAGLNRVFQFNSTSGSDTASPSASSASQWNGNANSSTGTSPEPSHGSPMHKSSDKLSSGARNQSPLATSNQTIDNNTFNLPSFETFDPVLFGDYRDTQDAVIGSGDFTGGFFDEALQPFDYSSPTNLFGILQSPQPQTQQLQISSSNKGPANAPTPSRNLMAEIDKTREGVDDDYGLPQTEMQVQKPSMPLRKEDGKYISCNNIWAQLQSNPDFQEGKFDLDSLCSELKAKARCSESGVLVDQEHVDSALRKLGKKDDKTGQNYSAPAGLMFEQESWDNVLKKLGNNKA